ncbi:MAG: SUMF1/EgtB/PvdO family nonheme iron enzyme, partial [Desulfobacteraceae bacterium]
IEEPVAAAIGYSLNSHNLGRGILVYDFGGGTFDIAFIVSQDKDNYHIPLPTDGDNRCGGNNIDQALYEHWEILIKKRYARPICATALEMDIGFLTQCRLQKESLTDTTKGKFSVKLPPPGVLRVTRTIDRQTINQLMRPIIDKTILKTQSMLKKIEKAGHELDTVILAGGSSRIPLVMERLKKILPVIPIEPMRTDVAVCVGALLANQSTIKNNISPLPKVRGHKEKKQTFYKEISKEISPSGGDIWQEPLTGMHMIWVPPGSFQMGSPLSEKDREEDEGPLHSVTLDGFWLGQYPVTQGQWQKIMESNPSRFKSGDNYPVEYVSWKDTQQYIKKINQLVDGRYRFHLPTEAQWEYACRSGTSTPFYFGENLTTDQANYNGHFPYGDASEGVYREKTTPVGTFPANNFGIYDMHGNVWEWCQDLYAGEYPSGNLTNPKGPSSGVSRVLRGGCWNDGAWICRSAYRNLSTPGSRHSYTGFRLAMIPV